MKWQWVKKGKETQLGLDAHNRRRNSTATGLCMF